MLDRVFTQARIFDGTTFREESVIGIQGDEIAYLGNQAPESVESIDVGGRVICPGFIDTHTHSDYHCLDSGIDGHSSLAQGVTTQVVGNCGFSATPEMEAHPILLPGEGQRALPLAGLQEQLSKKLALNISHLMGHSSLRTHVLGEARVANDRELDEMTTLLDDFLASGGAGMSVGLNYPEAQGSDEKELIALGKVLAKHDRPLTCHMRDQGEGILEAMDEVQNVGRQTGCSVLISHLRPISDINDHFLDAIFERIESEERFAMDLYPYNAGFTSLAWLFQFLFERHPLVSRTFSEEELWDNARRVCVNSLDDIQVLVHRDERWCGKFMPEIAASLGLEKGETTQKLYLDDPNTLCIFHHQSTNEAVDMILKHPKCFIGSDGYLYHSGHLGHCHPRNYASFAGFLCRYVQTGLVSLEEGLRRVTSGPADYFKFDNGRIAQNSKADFIIFDPDKVEEHATYLEPCRAATGIDEVVLNGQTAFKAGKVVPERAGRYIKTKGNLNG